MAETRIPPESDGNPQRRPATTPEAREHELVNLAYDLAESRLRSGKASAQEVTYLLKVGSQREKLEKKKLELESELLVTKRDSIVSAASADETYKNALEAMRTYTGQSDADEEIY